MNHIDPLQFVFERLGCTNPAKVALFFWDEVKEWPSGALDNLVASGLLQPAQPMTSIECDGCEKRCIDKPVVVYPAQEDKPGRAFIACDEREGMGRIRVSFERLKQWQCSADGVCKFVTASLGLRHGNKHRTASADFLVIGMASGNKRSQMLGLQTDGELMLVAGSSKFLLADLIDYRDGAYTVDAVRVRQLIDSATTADKRYTPGNAKREARKLDTQATYKDWQKAYRDLTKKRPNMPETWYANQIAKLPVAKGRSAGTIKKNMQP